MAAACYKKSLDRATSCASIELYGFNCEFKIDRNFNIRLNDIDKDKLIQEAKEKIKLYQREYNEPDINSFNYYKIG